MLLSRIKTGFPGRAAADRTIQANLISWINFLFSVYESECRILLTTDAVLFSYWLQFCFPDISSAKERAEAISGSPQT